MIRWLLSKLPECWHKGHDIDAVDGQERKLAYQKGDARQVVDYYSGVYYFCKRRRCKWTRYTGSTQPYRRDVAPGDTHDHRRKHH
jgi:hypothetical protein